MPISDDHDSMPNAHANVLDGFVETQLPSDLRYEIETTIDGNATSFGHAYIRTHDAGSDVLVEATWRESSSSSSSHSTPRQALLFYFHRPASTFPQFEIIPRDGLGTRILSVAAGALGLPTLNLPGEPELMKRYMIVTANHASVRSLFDRASIDALIKAHDLRIKSTMSAFSPCAGSSTPVHGGKPMMTPTEMSTREWPSTPPSRAWHSPTTPRPSVAPKMLRPDPSRKKPRGQCCTPAA